MKKRPSFTRLIQVWGIILILGVAVSITFVDISRSWHDLKQRSKMMRQGYMDRQKRLIKEEVERVVDLISCQRAQRERITREMIKKRVLEAYNIAQYIYDRNKLNKTSAEIQQMIIDALRPIRFAGGTGYYYITDTDGNAVLNAGRPELEGLHYSQLADPAIRAICKRILEISKGSKQGFYEYYWFKPGETHKKYKKISFFKRFEPFHWIIGSGLYVDDIDRQIRSELLSMISKIRFGKEGYIFINRFNGDALVSNGKVIEGHKKLWEVFNKDPERVKRLFQIEYDAAMKPEGDYIHYAHVKLTDAHKKAPKISYIFGLPDLKWLVGAGVYLDDIEADVNLLQEKLTRQILVKIAIFSLIAFGISAVFLLLLNRLNKKLRNDIVLFMRFFDQAASSNEPIDRSKVQFQELDQIAKCANEMIEDRKKIEEALRQSESKFRDLVEASSDLIWEFKLDGQILTYVSPQVKDILGYSPEEVIGKSIKNFMPPEEAERLHEIINELMESAAPISSLEHILIHKDGHHVIVETSGNPFFDKDGNLEGYRGVDRDITRRKKAEEDLQKMQRLKSVGTLAGGIAHDFNNILTGVFGNIEVARFKMSPGHEAYPYILKAGNALERATNLTKQLLTFARGGDPVLDTVDLKELLQSCVAFNLSGSNVRANFRLPPGLWHIKADKGQIDQVIANLIINAKDAMPKGGNLYIEAENIEDIQEDTAPHLKGDFVKITVRDEGVGIDEDHISRIFDPYFSTKQTGAGLGLATVHSIVRKHKGHITVESVLGQGTTFTVFLPAERTSEDLPGESGEFFEPGSSVYTAARILIMDDEQMVRDVSAAMLERLGYGFDFAADGQEALEKYRSSIEDGRPFDVVIMDLTIPGGMGGREASAKLLEMDPKARIIVSSGYSTDPIMANFTKYGFKGRLVKPFRLDDLEEVLKQVLKE